MVREALTRLAEQELIVSLPQRGFQVRDLSVRDITDVAETRVEIESAALRLAIERSDVRWETGIVAAHHFHQALLAGCGNVRLEGIAQGLRDSAELYRAWYWVLTGDHHRDIADKHRRFKDLTVARDVDAAVELLTEHIARAPRQLIAYALEHGVDNLHQPQSRAG